MIVRNKFILGLEQASPMLVFKNTLIMLYRLGFSAHHPFETDTLPHEWDNVEGMGVPELGSKPMEDGSLGFAASRNARWRPGARNLLCVVHQFHQDKSRRN